MVDSAKAHPPHAPDSLLVTQMCHSCLSHLAGASQRHQERKASRRSENLNLPSNLLINCHRGPCKILLVVSVWSHV